MNPYFSLLATRLKTMLQYREAAFAGFITQLFWGFIRIMVMAGFYASTNNTQPLNFQQVAAYVWLGQAFLGLLPWNVDRDIQEMVDKGTVAYELLRPLDLYALWFCRTLAWRAATVSLRAIPLLLISSLLLPLLGAGSWALVFPAAPLQLAAFLLAMLLVLFLSSSFTTLIHLSLIWTISGKGMSRILPSLILILSGMVVPLPFYPRGIRRLLELLPFAGLVDNPYRIFMGHIPPAGYAAVFLHQFVWLLILVSLGRLLLSRAMKKMVIQGG